MDTSFIRTPSTIRGFLGVRLRTDKCRASVMTRADFPDVYRGYIACLNKQD